MPAAIQECSRQQVGVFVGERARRHRLARRLVVVGIGLSQGGEVECRDARRRAERIIPAAVAEHDLRPGRGGDRSEFVGGHAVPDRIEPRASGSSRSPYGFYGHDAVMPVPITSGIFNELVPHHDHR